MDIYTDYGHWKFENLELINALTKLNSKIISRFSHTILVVDTLYNQYVENHTLSPELEVIFDAGFNYLNDRFLLIKSILDSEYRGNIKEMDKNAKTINLLLYIQDYEDELMDQPNYDQKAYDELSKLEDQVNGYIERHEEIPDEYFGLLDDISFKLFDEFQGVNEIMYDVALDLDLLEDDDSDIDYINTIFSKPSDK